MMEAVVKSFLVLISLIFSFWPNDFGTVAARSSGFYADNGIDQTIIYQQISKKERREMQQEILSLLGLQHRPKPTPHGTENSAPKFMMNLYHSFIDEESGDLKLNQMKEVTNFTDDSINVINNADVIMSFVNHGWRIKSARRCRKLKLEVRAKMATCKRSKKPIPKAGHHLSHLRHDKDRRFWFDVSEVPPDEMIMEAQLRLYKEAIQKIDKDNNVDSFNISVFKLIQGSDLEDRELHYLDSVSVNLTTFGWIQLNVSGATSDWVYFPVKNQGLYLTIQKEGQSRELHPRDIGLIGNKGPADRQPFMVAFFKASQELHVRRTRAANRKQRQEVSYNDHDYNIYSSAVDKNLAKRSCQTRTLYVSFKELGWQDWIIAPDGYAAFFCNGECSFPLNAQMNATNHAIVQTLVNLMKPSDVPKPCCAPTKLSPISVLYFDDNSNVILKKYKNMVVKACGCH